MPSRKIVLATDEIYHVVNRSIEQIPIFKGKGDYQRALEVIDFYRYANPPLSFSSYKKLSIKARESFYESLIGKKKILVEIFAFCLMPNHFHLLLKQKSEKGISHFMRRFQNSYAKFFNTKYNRAGGLFQSIFKAIRVETDEQFLHVARYIFLNPVTAYLIEIKQLINYPWSAFSEYLTDGPTFINREEVLNFFKTKSDFKKFVFDQADYQRELDKIKHLALEN